MAITYIGNGEYRADTAADTKPTTGIYIGARLTELDTRQEFYWTGTNWTNRLITVQADISGATEIVGSWTLGNSTGGSKIEFANASSTNAIFSPWIRAYNLDDATHPGMYLYAYVDTTHDTGTQSIMRFDVRKTDNSALTTRPLYSFRNAGTEVFSIGQTSFGFANKDLFNIKAITTTGAITVSKAAEAGGEILQLWNLSDGGSSQIEFRNASGIDGEFAPWIRVYNYTANATHPGLYLYSHILNTQDTGTMPALIFDSRKTDAAAITTRPLFDFRTAGTSVFKINANGDVLQTVTAQAATFETLHNWQMSDDATSFLKVFNNTNVDGHFSPMLIAQYDKNLATIRAFTLRGVIPTALDSGTVPVTIFDSRKADGSLITVRPLFDFHNVNTSVMQIKAGGDVLHNILAQSGAAEILGTWQMSDGGSSRIEIRNSSAADGEFIPQIRAFNQIATNTGTGLLLDGFVLNTQDSGTVPVTVFRAFRSDSTAITTRPLFDFRNANTSVFKIDPLTVSTVLPITVTKNAETDIAEMLSTWQVAAAGTSRMEIRNATATGGEFHPQLRSFNMSANNAGPGLWLDSFIVNTQDIGSNPVTIFRAWRHDSTSITTRPLFDFRNADTSVFKISPSIVDSTLTYAINKTAIASTAETLQSWKVSDDASSVIEIVNAVPTDAQFVPLIQSSNHLANASFGGLYVYGRILAAQDSGTVPVMIFDARTTALGAITNRPLFSFRNAAVTIFTINQNSFDFNVKELKGEYFMDKIGQYSCSSMYDVDGWGLLSGLQGYGNFAKNLDSSGSGHFWDTGTTIGTAAGVAQLGAVGTFMGWMRSANLPFVKARIVVPSYTAADSRFYFGWYTTATLVPNSDTPMNVNDGGVLIGYRSTDTNYQIFRGPADGSTTPPAPIDTGIAVPASAALNFFEIKVNSATSIDVTIYNSSGVTVLYTTNLTTNLPASTKSLNFNAILYNTTTTLKRLTIYSMAMRSNT